MLMLMPIHPLLLCMNLLYMCVAFNQYAICIPLFCIKHIRKHEIMKIILLFIVCLLLFHTFLLIKIFIYKKVK